MRRRGDQTKYLRSQRGVTLIECLVASLIVGVSLAGIVSLWYFAFNMTVTTDRRGVAYLVGREALETVKETGFNNTTEGAPSYTWYYDGNGNAIPQSSAVYTAVVNVSSELQSGTVGSYSLRTVTITVSLSSGGSSLFQTGTYLVRYGI